MTEIVSNGAGPAVLPGFHSPVHGDLTERSHAEAVAAWAQAPHKGRCTFHGAVSAARPSVTLGGRGQASLRPTGPRFSRDRTTESEPRSEPLTGAPAA